MAENLVILFDKTINHNTLPQTRVHGGKGSKVGKSETENIFLNPGETTVLLHVAKLFNFQLTNLKSIVTVEYNPLENTLKERTLVVLLLQNNSQDGSHRT